MEVRIKKDSVEIEGYVNAIERNSKPLISRIGKFIERICKNAFKTAINRNDNIRILLNHDWNRDLGGTKQGNLELHEDNIGLKARAVISDREIIQKARQGDLVGWSFGFEDRDVVTTIENGITMRAVKDMDLHEVSILDRTKNPAYEGTLLLARSEAKKIHYRSEPFLDGEVNLTECRDETEEAKPPIPETNPVDYTKYENMIKKMKGALSK